MTYPGAHGDQDVPRPPLETPATTADRPGDKHEFADFYREHLARLVTYLIYQGAPAHMAADIAQDSMTIAYRRWHEIKSPRSYVYKVAHRAFLHRALDHLEQLFGEVPAPTAVLPRPGGADAWLQEQEIIQVLRALPPRQRQVLALTIDGWTPAEIADLFEIDSATVRANLKKARRNAAKNRRVEEDP